MPRQLLPILLLLTILLTACGRSNDLPTLVPTADPGLIDNEDREDESPRATPSPDLPPTWTPAPTPLPATPMPTVGPTPEQQFITYTIQPGDTLGLIAQRYGITVEELAALNNITDINRIEVGDVLRIRQTEP
jgi:peptidoglycan DL-endopeptidase CwlS